MPYYSSHDIKLPSNDHRAKVLFSAVIIYNKAILALLLNNGAK
jgi:hypothetical protein